MDFEGGHLFLWENLRGENLKMGGAQLQNGDEANLVSPSFLPSLKLTFSPLKIAGWKMKSPFGMANFQGPS